MTWTDIPDSSIDPGKPARSIDAKALRDNIAHVRNGNNLVTIFTSSGTYTKPAGLKRMKVTLVAGGGGGGGCDAISGSIAGFGGSAGGISVKVIEAASLASSETVTIGAGGGGSTGNTTAGTGGTSSFGAHCSATGGAGGFYAHEEPGPNLNRAVAPPVGGAGSGGDINYYGPIPPVPYRSFDGSTSILPLGGAGADALFGFGRGGAGRTAAGNGNAAAGYGAGGGGAFSIGATQSGGAGRAGICIIEEFF